MDFFSEANLVNVEPKLVEAMRLAYILSPIPFRITCGCRTKREQDSLFFSKMSDHRYPQSRHNQRPSTAIDFETIADFSDLAKRAQVAELIKQCAIDVGCQVYWRGEDSGHIELV